MTLSSDGQVESFLVRVIREPGGYGQIPWRIQVRHIQSGDCFHCLDIQEVPGLMRQVLDLHPGADAQGWSRAGIGEEA